MKITKYQLRRIIRESLLCEWQYGMDRDPSGQEVRDQVGAYQSTYDPDNHGWNDEAYEAALAAGPKALAGWLVSNRDSGVYNHLFLGGIWAGVAKWFRFDPEEVQNIGLKLDPKAFENWDWDS